MIKILVTGANGQLGATFAQLAKEFPSWHFLFADRSLLNIAEPDQVLSFFQKHTPHYCINTAAYTAVDRAEEEPLMAHAVNVDGAAALASACADTGTHLFHYSTDYVYQGDINRPLRETDPTSPVSVYAQSKLGGEQTIRAILPDATIIRTSWVYSEYGHNFVKTMLRLGKERDQLNVVFDQVGTPTYALDLAKASLEMIRQKEEGQCEESALTGIFHYSNEGVCSWYDFALAIFELSGISCSVQPIPSSAYPTPAQRPHYSVLDKAKIKAAFGLQIPHWRAGLRQCLAALNPS